MPEGPDIARIAALIGEPARANMLAALMRGGALTLSELAAEAGVGLATASAHAARLGDGGLVRARPAGRHRYMELASPAVAALLEQLMALSAGSPPALRRRPGPRDPALREARVCYDHLAGARGVQIYDSLTARGFLAHWPGGLTLTGPGRDHVIGLGVGEEMLGPARAPLCRECLDWSQRRSHLAGRLGRALLATMEARGWMRRVEGTREVRLGPVGRRAFDAAFPPASSA